MKEKIFSRLIMILSLFPIFYTIFTPENAIAGGLSDFVKNVKRETGRCFHGGCDVIYQVNRRFDSGLRSKAKSIAEPFRQIYFEIATDLFNNRMPSLLNKLDGLAEKHENNIQDIVKQIEGTSMTIVDRAADAAIEVTTEVRQQIIEESRKQIDGAIDHIEATINEIIDKADCAITKQTGGIETWLESILDFRPIHTDTCYINEGYRFGHPRLSEFAKIYRIRRCQLENDLYDAPNIQKVLNAISDLSLLSVRMTCILGGSTGTIDAHEHAIEYANAYSIWQLTLDK